MPMLPITARIDGRDFTREDVLAWETRRARKAARRLRIATPAVDPASLVPQVVDRKLELGREGLRRLMRRDVRVSAPLSRAGAVVSRGHRRVATTVLTCEAGSAELVPAWYQQRFRANDAASMLAASPDHWVFDYAPGVEEVIETTGGSPLAVQMFFDHDAATLQTPPTRPFPSSGPGRLATRTVARWVASDISSMIGSMDSACGSTSSFR